MKTYYTNIEKEIRTKVGNKKVFLLVSGGVDSTVCFTLLNPYVYIVTRLHNGIDNSEASSLLTRKCREPMIYS